MMKRTRAPWSRLLSRLCAAGLGLALGSCGGGGTPAPVGVLTSLAVSPSAPALFIGDSQQFTATGSYSNGSSSTLTTSVAWSSSNTQVVTISSAGSSAGLASVQGSGTVTIRAAIGSLSSLATLKASAKLLSVTVTPAKSSIPLGLTQQFKATGAYNDGSSKDLTSAATWSSSNKTVATVNAAGLASSTAAGAVTITATMSAVNGTASLSVGPAVAVSLSPGVATVSVGGTQQFAATVANTSNTAVAWSVDGVAGGNATTGTLSSSGLYTTPAGPGTHQISASSQLDPTKTAQASATVSYAGMLTYHNDLARTGQNLNETTLTPLNVNSTQFGKLFAYPVDANIYAQPLYVASVTIPGQGIHNVVYVTTMNDSVYAFDANGKSSGPLWHSSFLKPGVTSVSASAVFDDTFPGGEIGILGTPVIDPLGGTLYVVSYTTESGQYVYRLHALDLASGAEKSGGPVVIQATATGDGVDNDGHNHVAFTPLAHLQRPGLLLLNGVVYVGFGSHADTGAWHGWLLGYDAATLQQTVAFNTTPSGSDGSLWAAGGAPAGDSSGNIYFATANGTFDANSGGSDYGDSILKLQSGSLTVLDWFAPFNTNFLCSLDLQSARVESCCFPTNPALILTFWSSPARKAASTCSTATISATSTPPLTPRWCRRWWALFFPPI